jgi:hypothetical protein
MGDQNTKPEELIQTLLKYLDDGQLKKDLARCVINLLAVGKNLDTRMCETLTADIKKKIADVTQEHDELLEHLERIKDKPAHKKFIPGYDEEI